jgi:hypothetical protein
MKFLNPIDVLDVPRVLCPEKHHAYLIMHGYLNLQKRSK